MLDAFIIWLDRVVVVHEIGLASFWLLEDKLINVSVCVCVENRKSFRLVVVCRFGLVLVVSLYIANRVQRSKAFVSFTTLIGQPQCLARGNDFDDR